MEIFYTDACPLNIFHLSLKIQLEIIVLLLYQNGYLPLNSQWTGVIFCDSFIADSPGWMIVFSM